MHDPLSSSPAPRARLASRSSVRVIDALSQCTLALRRVVAQYLDLNNIFGVFLALAGIMMLNRPAGVTVAVEVWSHGLITSEMFAVLFIIAGAYAFERRMGDVERLLVLVPLIFYVALAFVYALVTPNVSFTPSLIVAAYVAEKLYVLVTVDHDK